jgi:hypothetical protein
MNRVPCLQVASGFAAAALVFAVSPANAQTFGSS